MRFRDNPNGQSFIPKVDYCNVCNKQLIGRGTKYLDKTKDGYLCREHAKKQGIRVFRPFGKIPVKSTLTLIVVTIAVILFTGCSQPTALAEIDNADVNVVITDNGIGVDKIINIGKFHPGARAEIVYSIRNASHAAVQPVLFADRNGRVEDYSQADGAVTYPAAYDWLEIPEVPELTPGETANVLVAVEMPKDYKMDKKKIGFAIAAATQGKQIQLAVSNWWLISMR